jgi:hypothetical protein
MEVMAVILSKEYVGGWCSPVCEENRRVAEIAYIRVVARAPRRDRIAIRLMELVQTILWLPGSLALTTLI